MKRKNQVAQSAGVSVEVIVATAVISASLLLLMLTLFSGRSEKADGQVVQQPARYHRAVELSPVVTSEQEGVSSTSGDTIVRDSVTVVSPPLLVPVVNIDPTQIEGPDGATISREGYSSRHRSHRISRARVAHPDRTRIVGLSAARKIVSANP